jgi:hypothetical protein
MGGIISFFIKAIVYLVKKIIIPLIKFALYIMAICFVFCVISNLAGLFGLILFMVVFYYYVKGIIMIEPGGGGTGSPMQAIGAMLPATNTATSAIGKAVSAVAKAPAVKLK